MAGRRSAGFLFVAILDTFQVNRSEGSWPIMLMGGLVYLAGLITGPLAHRFNARPVIIAGAVISGVGAMVSFFPESITAMTVTLGAIHAIGAGMVFVVSPTIISEHFVKHKGLAMGINFTGVTMGTFAFPKLLEYLTKSYGLRGALLIFGAIVMNGLAFSLFPRTPKWRSVPPEQKQGSPAPSCAEKHGTLRHGLTVFKHPIFYLVMYSFIVHSFGFECYISLFVDFAVDRGVAVSSAVTMVSMGAIAEALGRLTLPAAVDRGWLTNKQLIVIIFSVQGSMFILLPFLYVHGLIFAVAVVIAYTIGTGLVLFPVILAAYLGLERMSMSYGMVIASAGLLSFIKPSVVGHFRDHVGAYDVLFIICGSLIAFAALIWILVFTWELRQRKKQIMAKPGGPTGDVSATRM
ncbi:monocarboxylate transporter 12-like isoform X2 [Amblyomma americanum]|uniref:Major facilitator superfamily (MFS) profile domain-containing protein n=1 Tax=Amblyomma americanum TaxID=6943 RepID=A0AAQ4E3L4_AMBAM